MIDVDDADLSLIEINHPSPLVQRLIWKIRELQDEVLSARADTDHWVEKYHHEIDRDE